MVPRIIMLALLGTGAIQAEFLRIEVFITDMNCTSCSESLVATFQKMRGVEKAEADLKTGMVRLELAAQNRVGIEQVWDAIKRVGFTPGDSKVTVRGAVKAGKLTVGEKGYEVEGPAAEGDSVELQGKIKPPPGPSDDGEDPGGELELGVAEATRGLKSAPL